jgi:hypothetical protein
MPPMARTHPVKLVRTLEAMPPSRRQWRQWVATEPVLSGITFDRLRADLLDRRVPHHLKDELLGALLRLAAHDADAASAIAICLLPGLIRMARRFAPALDPDEAWSELIAGLLEGIRRYPLGRRPERIAANLLWDAADRLWRSARAERDWRERACALVDNGEHSEPELSTTALLEIAVDAGVLNPLDSAIINVTRVGGLRLDHTAKLLGVPYEAAKKRRQRAEAAWTSWWAPERQLAA